MTGVAMVRSDTGRIIKKVTFMSISILKRSSSIPIADAIDVPLRSPSLPLSSLEAKVDIFCNR